MHDLVVFCAATLLLACSSPTDDPPANIAPSVTIIQSPTQQDPTFTGPVLFDVEFSEPVTGFDALDVSLVGSTEIGLLSVNVDGSGGAYNVAVLGMTGTGTVTASIPAGVATDAGGRTNLASTSVDNTVTFLHPPTVTVNQGPQQADPTNVSPIVFVVQFSAPVIGFNSRADVNVSGSAVGTIPSFSLGGSGASYTVTVDAFGPGTVMVSVPAGAAQDAGGAWSLSSTSIDNTVTFQ